MTMKETERLFTEAKSMFASNQTLTSDKVVQIQGSQSNKETDICSKNDDGIVHGYQSRFANLPLYQGYGIIAHQIALSNKANTAKKSTPESHTLDNDGNDQQTSINVVNESINVKELSDQNETEINLVANAFAHLLDESLLKFLYEATSQQLVGSGSLNLFEPPAYIESLPHNKQVSFSDSIDDGTIHQNNENYSITDLSRFNQISKDETEQEEDEQKHRERISDLSEIQRSKSAVEGLGQKAIRFGVGAQGAFRVAWSEMPEVLESNCLQRLTRHEIQLQEAMFEVITSEASYYQSLNVLVNHFYHAPEFECEPLHSPVQGNQINNKTIKESNSPPFCNTMGQQDTTNVNNQVMSEPSTPSVVTTPVGLTITNPTNINNNDSTDISLDGNTSTNQTTRRPLLKPLEKHHLFSNVLLVCLASETFLRDLEARWESRMPILNEVCDLIVKHAGGVNFEPYITYLRNQTYQMATLRKLCKRDSFRSALDNLHAHPKSGKNMINSFLALPMQRLTRLKLLVEVIRRLQDAVIRDSKDKTLEKRPFRVPSDRERENVQLALRELDRLLTASETEKELMDRKSRLLTLSTSLEFPDNVKRIAISDKRLIKEGELRECLSDNGRMSVFQKLVIRKPNTFYLILFNDLLLVTKKKKNERFLVLDYCDRASVQSLVQRNGDPFNPRTNLLKNPKNSISAEPLCHIEPINDDLKVNTQKSKRFLSPESEDDVNNNKCKSTTEKRHRRYKTTNEFKNVTNSCSIDNHDELARVNNQIETSESSRECSNLSNKNISNLTFTSIANTTTTTTTTTDVVTKQATNCNTINMVNTNKTINLSRSGSSLSGYRLRLNHEKNRHIKSSIFGTTQLNTNTLVNCKTNIIYLKLLGSHNGTCTELILSSNDNQEFENWCKAFSVSSDNAF
ncbi:Ephexin-1 [Schistosoma japonicum]|uniref:Ephexin-1 n=1 Tax=Schistosoma japonicum TaxID=6182 RepID=A0A4Z2DH52_SCHJA|nr:Ephexin-1 [Schistosoma japonicum]